MDILDGTTLSRVEAIVNTIRDRVITHCYRIGSVVLNDLDGTHTWSLVAAQSARRSKRYHACDYTQPAGDGQARTGPSALPPAACVTPGFPLAACGPQDQRAKYSHARR